MKKPFVGVPIGDPAGIGPEIALKSLLDDRLFSVSNTVLIGDKAVLEDQIKLCNLPLKINVINNVKEGVYEKGVANLIEMKEIDAIATTPINKESLNEGKVPYIGHTEILADLSNTNDPLTMFEIEKERVFFLSRHVSLKEAIDLVKKDRLVDYIKRSIEALDRLGVKGTLAVAGLNPHSGEGGLFGSEEIDEIIPAVKEMQEKGYDVIGPIPADSIFALGLDGRWAGILSLYHDQGHIATKTYDFHKTISITNGMPFLRTSVDHGTALDIAGKNKANEVSMIEAIVLAAKYAPFFKNTNK